jgi:hypothetical protein
MRKPAQTDLVQMSLCMNTGSDGEDPCAYNHSCAVPGVTENCLEDSHATLTLETFHSAQLHFRIHVYRDPWYKSPTISKA